MGFVLVVLIIVIIGCLLQLLVRLLLLVALALVVFGATYLPPTRGKIPAIVAGIAGGFMNTLAGAAGPAITVYAQASKWDQQRFAATLQPIFVISGLVSFIVKIVAGAGTITQISAWIWILGIAGMFLGISLGARASRTVSRTHARKLALLLATGGEVSAVVRGLTGIQERVPHDRNSRGAP
ncbi:sulfite exporter TauE/SafE family protein [Corynebacterium diphtheriae bv. mitis]|nr:sulfite exporter TauE/SafE family protein [Corynebacterium diphtheriae bv. mitis]MBG9282045.1 sulfite exporter TauE/SafE family protein [Corynebacterium diphtheriae bv. mitis]MBG9371339.1 sulfite exporter TauE/SafE family protein [Corynebacterium diphtheriae bv. mitis]